MGLISWIVVGIIAGLLASWILPGPGSGGFTGVSLMILTGMAGASVGGFVFNILGETGLMGFNVWSILVATFGASILLFVYDLVARRSV